MLKNYNYILTIVFYPFTLLLSYLKLTNSIKGNIYNYLILIMLFIFIPSFIMSLYNALEDILNSKKKWRVIILIFLSIFYLPIYYTKYVAKEEKYLGYILFIIGIPITLLFINSVHVKLSNYLSNAYRNYVVVNDNYVYHTVDNLFSIDVDKSFRCNNTDIGDYVISCDRLEDDSFIGIYSYDVSYDSEEDIDKKLEFHIEQTINYIEENGYTYELINDDNHDLVQINYNQNAILIKESNYEFSNCKYSLIIMKEVPKDLINYEQYQKMIDSIKFLNYNDEGVSS